MKRKMVLFYFFNFLFYPIFITSIIAAFNHSIVEAMVLFKWQGLNLLKASIGIERTRPSVLSVLYSTALQINKNLIALRVSY